MKYVKKAISAVVTSSCLFLLLVESQELGFFAIPILCALIALGCAFAALWRPWLVFVTVSAWYIAVVSTPKSDLKAHSVPPSRLAAIDHQMRQDQVHRLAIPTTTSLSHGQIVWLSLAGLTAALGLAPRRKTNHDTKSWPLGDLRYLHVYR